MADFELGAAVAEYQNALTKDQQVASLKKVSSQVKHKALAESTAVSIIDIVTEALAYGSDVRDAALALLSYLVRRIHSQGQLSSSNKIAAALNAIPNWPDVLNELRKRGVPADVRNQLQEALERPPSSSGSGQTRLAAGAERKQAFQGASSRPGSSASGALKPSQSKPAVAAPPDNGLEPIYVSSSSNLDQLCQEMLPDFEGKESEFNWPRRDKNMTKLRQITKGNAPTDFPNAYLANWKILFEGIVKCVTSLRTTFSTNSCQFMQEAVAAIGHGLDSYTGRLLEMSVKMCGDTKPIAAQNGNTSVVALINHLSWNRHMMTIVTDACQDKNARPREFAYGWLKTAFEVHSHHKATLEQGGGLETIDKCFRRGIADTNPKVRETARRIFWDFHRIWPTRGDAILTSLDERTQKALKSANTGGGADANAAAGPAASTGAGSRAAPAAKPKAAASRPSIKDMMAAKRREKAMERPQSALAALPSTDPKAAKKPAASANRPAQETPTVGGLSSAPVRPGRKVISRAVSRPELSAAAESADRPKTPFRNGVARRPESRADEKRTEGPRRPVSTVQKPGTATGAAVTAAAPAAAAPVVRPPVKRIPAPSSLPASPEKAFGSPASRRPKSITEDSPLFRRTQELPERLRLGTPTSPERRFKALESPTQTHAFSSRLSTPAKVYEDPRSSPSPSLLPTKTGSPVLSPKSVGSHRIDGEIAATLKSFGPGDNTMNGGEGFSPVKMPLMELSTNEVNAPASAGKGDPRSAKLIDSGIVHMKSGRLDPHGYRKLHAAVAESLDAISPQKFEELLNTVLVTAPSGQENANGSNPTISSERILVQRLHLISALSKSELIQPYMAQVLRALIHIVRHDTRHDGHTYWVAEDQLREFASVTSTQPNEAARGVLAQPQDVLHVKVLKCLSFLVQNKLFDRDDGDLVSVLADVAGQAITADADVDARMQGHELAKALGIDTIQKFLGEDTGGVAFMLYQSMKGSL